MSARPAEPLPGVTGRDLEVLAQTLWGEARGEGRRGLIAVAWVIRHRVALAQAGTTTWWGDTVAHVCQANYQFSCWLESDPNREKMLAASLDDPLFVDCWYVALDVCAGRIADPVPGCTHYLAPGARPKWARGLTPAHRIKNHRFFKDVP